APYTRHRTHQADTRQPAGAESVRQCGYGVPDPGAVLSVALAGRAGRRHHGWRRSTQRQWPAAYRRRAVRPVDRLRARRVDQAATLTATFVAITHLFLLLGITGLKCPT